MGCNAAILGTANGHFGMSDQPWIKGRLLRWLTRRGDTEWGRDPGHYDPALVEETLRWVRRFIGPLRYFRIDARGMHDIPSSPVLVVSNHSGGTTIPDVWGFLESWYSHFGVERPLHPMAHEMVFSTSMTAPYFARRGVLRASPSLGLRVLTEWKRDLMVMPGGDLDTWRPWSERYKVRFGGRVGYARLALRAGVPIVPVANVGAHETFMVLTDGRKLAKAIHLKEIARSDVFPIHLSLPWGLGIGPLPHIPLPGSLRYRVGRPIPPPRRFDPDEPIPEKVLAAHDQDVREAIQRQLDDLKNE